MRTFLLRTAASLTIAALLLIAGNGTAVPTAHAQVLLGEPPVGGIHFVIAMTDGVYEAAPGEMLTYRISVTNDSPIGVANVRITDSVPRELMPIFASDNGYIADQYVQWHGLTFGPSEMKILELRATVAVFTRNAAVISNTVQIEGGPAAQDTTIVQRVGAGKGIQMSITKNPESTQAGGTLTYTVTINNSDTDTRSIDVRASLDRRMAFVTASDQGHNRNSSQIIWNNVFIGASASKTLTATVRVTDNAQAGDQLKFQVNANDALVEDTAVVNGSAAATGGTSAVQQPYSDSVFASPYQQNQQAAAFADTSTAPAATPEQTLLPQTGIGDFTATLENTRKFLMPFSTGSGSSPFAIILWTALAIGGLVAGSAIGRKTRI